MAKKLHSLMRISDWNVDEARRALGALLRQAEDLRARLERLRRELVEEQRAAANAPTEAGLTFGAYAEQSKRRDAELRELIHDKDAEVEAAREELRLAYLEAKKFEIAQRVRDDAEAHETALADQADLDEVGIMGHRRKN